MFQQSRSLLLSPRRSESVRSNEESADIVQKTAGYSKSDINDNVPMNHDTHNVYVSQDTPSESENPDNESENPNTNSSQSTPFVSPDSDANQNRESQSDINSNNNMDSSSSTVVEKVSHSEESGIDLSMNSNDFVESDMNENVDISDVQNRGEQSFTNDEFRKSEMDTSEYLKSGEISDVLVEEQDEPESPVSEEQHIYQFDSGEMMQDKVEHPTAMEVEDLVGNVNECSSQVLPQDETSEPAVAQVHVKR